MASFKTVLLLFIGLQAFGVTSSVRPEDIDIDEHDLKMIHSGAVCQECVEGFELFDDLLSNKQIQEKMVDLLVHVCADLPESKTCEKQAKETLPLVINMVTTFIQPEQVCEILKACHSSKLYLPLSYYSRAAEASFFKCTVCQTAMHIVNSLLPKHRTKELVIEALKKLCRKVPFGMGGLCETMVHRYANQLINLLLENATPRNICRAIRMCRLHEESFEEDCETCSSPFSSGHDDSH